MKETDEGCIGGCDWTLTADYGSDIEICRKCGRAQILCLYDKQLDETD